MNTITLDPQLTEKLNNGMRSGDVIELPFPVIYIWALNGQATYKSQASAAPALYYGGWACKADDALLVAEHSGLTVPADWKRVAMASRDGNEIDAFVMRNVIVAPIAKRESWLLDMQRSPHYVDGARRHVQALAYLAEAKGENGNKAIIPWGPVVLTAKGYQAKNLLDSFRQWDKGTASLRSKIAPGVPSWCFYLSIGTFGKERQAVNVGKSGAQSPITPISAYIPDDLTEERITRLFVGQEVAGLMADYMDQAAEWLRAWKAPVEETYGPAGGEISPEPEYVDDIPF